MNEIIKEFKDGVYNQAIASGCSPEIADKISAQAVLDRASANEAGFAIAQSADFSALTVYNFDIVSYGVDQAGDGSVVLEAVLLDSSTDLAGQSFSYNIFQSFVDQINAGGILGYVDEHGEFRATMNRDKSKSVTESVKAFLKDGRIYITTKLKKGFEWVADKFKFLSLEAVVPQNKAIVTKDRKHFIGGELKGFSFTNNPKNPNHEIKSVRK